jgi:hypothetical protein
LQGISLTNYGGYAIDLYLTDGHVSSVRRSVPAEHESWAKVGISIAELRAILKMHLAENHKLVAFPIVNYEGDGWTKIVSSGDVPKTLSHYDAWTLVSIVPPGGAIYQVYFKDNKLTRIEYRRERVRLD